MSSWRDRRCRCLSRSVVIVNVCVFCCLSCCSLCSDFLTSILSLLGNLSRLKLCCAWLMNNWIVCVMCSCLIVVRDCFVRLFVCDCCVRLLCGIVVFDCARLVCAIVVCDCCVRLFVRDRGEADSVWL